MRNWNHKDLIRLITPRLSFHFTYEELKHHLQNSPPIFCLVSTLPMRNWNGDLMYGVANLYPGFHFTYEELKLGFIRSAGTNYLCRFHFTYEELKPGLLLIFIFFINSFPLYLWGIETPTNRLHYKSLYEFPLYLWGIETQRLLVGDASNNPCFHFTYEELKLE